MIQEVLGGSGAAGGHGLIGGEREIYPLTGNLELPSPSPSLSPSLSPSPSPTCSTNTTTTPTQILSENQNQNQLRCPRCDSSNTKFCYYNNYNLTQPRHFCKTCRRYWTKGGALRNVPIGGGCRKNHKTTSVGHVIPSLGKPSTGKLKTTVSSEIGKPLGFLSGFDHHELSSNPILWASPQSSHLMALLRSAQNPNPNSMLNSVSVKEEGFLSGSHTSSEPGSSSGALNARAGGLGLDPQVPSIGMCSNSFWRNNIQNQLAEQNGFMLGEIQSTGLIPDQLYQRLSALKSSANYYSDYSPAILVGNVHASSSANSSATILESAPVVAGGELGNYWNNPPFSWSDLQTTNGAYH